MNHFLGCKIITFCFASVFSYISLCRLSTLCMGRDIFVTHVIYCAFLGIPQRIKYWSGISNYIYLVFFLSQSPVGLDNPTLYECVTCSVPSLHKCWHYFQLSIKFLKIPLRQSANRCSHAFSSVILYSSTSHLSFTWTFSAVRPVNSVS